MDKKKRKHKGNKPKQQSTMKKKQQQNENHKSKSIHDILPLELIHRILLRVPVKDLGRLKCVSKLWNTLISDPDFAKSHLHLSAAPTHVCLFIYDYSNAFSVDIEAVFHRHTAVKEDKNDQEHFDCLSLRTNSWTNLDFALSKPLGTSNWQSRGFFLNGAIHWASFRFYSILIFDLKERSFSIISMPEQVMGYIFGTHLVLLGGCLALYSNDPKKTNIWVMKEYKVHSSWTFYQIPRGDVAPLCLSNGSDIVAQDSVLLPIDPYLRLAKYNVRGELLQHRISYDHHLAHVKARPISMSSRTSYIVYTESLVPVPSEIKDKDKKKKNGRQNQKNDVKQEKRTRSE
ncbi:F-box protein CPR1-like isoform X2 [Arachis stenosperma]|uniref:F-box protein CPR1-like isoform X2 n=1 Tax=Arachis stenosperma TaxID=217475 RepID=UPI0025AB7E8C|nr:F-box protein CPR1-like isoform X2 [Arachis stenosperma]